MCCVLSQSLGVANKIPMGSSQRFGIDVSGLLQRTYVKIVFNYKFIQ